MLKCIGILLENNNRNFYRINLHDGNNEHITGNFIILQLFTFSWNWRALRFNFSLNVAPPLRLFNQELKQDPVAQVVFFWAADSPSTAATFSFDKTHRFLASSSDSRFTQAVDYHYSDKLVIFLNDTTKLAVAYINQGPLGQEIHNEFRHPRKQFYFCWIEQSCPSTDITRKLMQSHYTAKKKIKVPFDGMILHLPMSYIIIYKKISLVLIILPRNQKKSVSFSLVQGYSPKSLLCL